MRFFHFESDIDGKEFDHLSIMSNDYIIGKCDIEYCDKNAYVTNLAVYEGCRRQGFGTELIKLIIDLCEPREIESITVQVKQDRPYVIAFYRKSGFFISLDYQDGSILMTKHLKEK
jgi:ribosomal protein S18 acetylase RimI-like enzyme